MDPLSLLVGGVLLGAGWLAGRFAPARRRGPKSVQPVCGCKHHLAYHDPKSGHCMEENRVVTQRDAAMVPVAWKEIPCTCEQYVGPLPIDSLYAPEIAG